jgi:hypothetical protein
MAISEKSGGFTPNLNISSGNGIIGSFHTHPYGPPDSENYTDVSLSGTDAEYITNNHQDVAIVQSGESQFAFVRTQETPVDITTNEAMNLSESKKNYYMDVAHVDFAKATQLAAEDVAQKYHLAYYEGQDGKLVKIGE